MTISRAGIRLPSIMSATLFLTGCLAPETINADITRDGYDYTLRVRVRWRTLAPSWRPPRDA